MKNLIAYPNLTDLPKCSALRLYSPATQGNSFWLDGFPSSTPDGADWVTRLVQMIEEWGVIGMTTNQTLFKQLMEAGVLDEQIKLLKKEGRTAEQTYSILYNEVAVHAAKIFSAVHAQWPWEGRVSQEASALLTQLEPLVRDIRRIAKAMEKVGSFTKIPNLSIGPQAIQKAVIEGTATSGAFPMQQVHPNITLVFSDRHYIQTVEAYVVGLSKRVENLRRQGFPEDTVCQDVSQIYSVNSLFVSRVDRVVDPMIEDAIQKSTTGSVRDRLRMIKGKVAVAQTKKIHQMFEAIFLEAPFSDEDKLYADQEGMAMLSTIWRLKDAFNVLKILGAHPQRHLVASSGVKSDQPYSKLLYVLPFLGPWTANTAPEGTLEHVTHFMESLSDQDVAALRLRNLMREPLPAIPTDEDPQKWDQILLMTLLDRQSKGILELTPGQILKDFHELVLAPRGTTLRDLCDAIRDKGAESFSSDEKATLDAIRSKFQTVLV